MFQLIKRDTLIPSCKIHALEFKRNKWTYIYAIDTPVELTDKNTEDFIIYEYISDLHVRKADSIDPNSVNIKFKTLTEYLGYLEAQREADISFRKQFLEKNPEARPNTFEIDNRNYSQKELQEEGITYLSGIMIQYENSTVFSGI